MDTRSIVIAGGLGLVGVNFWTSNQRPAIANVIFGDKGADPNAARSALVGIGGELLLVLILVMMAGASEALSRTALAIIAALWVLWGIHYYASPTGAKVSGKPWQNFSQTGG